MRLAEIVLLAEAEILQRFVDRVRRDISGAAPLEPQLIDDVPRLLRGLATQLEALTFQETEQTRTPAHRHGVQRRDLGYDLANLIREYGLLHQVILEVSAERGTEVSLAEHRTTLSFLNEASVHSVVAYVEERDAELAHQAARHHSFIAHELRNPLQTAVLAARAIAHERGASPPPALKRLERSLSQLGSLIDDTLMVATLRAEREPQREDIDACELVHQVVHETLQEAAERKVDLRAELPVTLPVSWDPKLMHSALTNLVRNAVKFTRTGTEVIIRGRIEAELAVLEVEDRCGGLPADYRELFEPDVQKGDNRSGFGLGLEIAQRAARSHGGEIRVRDLRDEGCVFALAVPFGRP